jgi:hypothetical protein
MLKKNMAQCIGLRNGFQDDASAIRSGSIDVVFFTISFKQTIAGIPVFKYFMHIASPFSNNKTTHYVQV